MRSEANRRFTYEESGEGPAILFLHGIGGSAAYWRGQLAHFGRTHRALAWDAPGYGGSAPLGEASIPALAEALLAFMAQTGLASPVLVGHSIGGMVVQEALAIQPDAARAVVLAQTSPAFGSRDGAWQAEFVRARLAPLEAGQTMAQLAEASVAEMAGPSADPAGLAAARECMAAVPPASYRAMVHAMIGFDRRDALGRIAAPALVLAGSDDANAPPAMMERMASRIPGARFAMLDGCGHLANLEQPAAFDATLDDFLHSLERHA